MNFMISAFTGVLLIQIVILIYKVKKSKKGWRYIYGITSPTGLAIAYFGNYQSIATALGFIVMIAGIFAGEMIFKRIEDQENSKTVN